MPPDTIFALSSGRPPAGVAVVRMSGPAALATLEHLTGRAIPPRVATLAALRDRAGALLDRALVLAFPAPASFTGEDVAELHLHGGAAVVAAVVGALAALGLRLAEPGEFSRRAFDNGKLDLSQAEGLADLIAAETEAQRRQALAQAGGRLRDRAEDWRLQLLALRAEAEAGLDFADEDDVEADAPQSPDLSRLAAEIGAVLDDNHVGERLRDGFTIAVVGPPNVGKSSLINALAKREAAIVTDIPGTTRDVLEVPLVIGGVPVTLLDTAGLRESDDPIEVEGIRRAKARASDADLVLEVGDATAINASTANGKRILVLNKIDLVARDDDRGSPSNDRRSTAVRVSAETGEGLQNLLVRLHDWATAQSSRAEAALITQFRHRLALQECGARLSEARAESDPVMQAEHLRLAAAALGRLTGRAGVEDMLDTLFGRFCIGK